MILIVKIIYNAIKYILLSLVTLLIIYYIFIINIIFITYTNNIKGIIKIYCDDNNIFLE